MADQLTSEPLSHHHTLDLPELTFFDLDLDPYTPLPSLTALTPVETSSSHCRVPRSSTTLASPLKRSSFHRHVPPAVCALESCHEVPQSPGYEPQPEHPRAVFQPQQAQTVTLPQQYLPSTSPVRTQPPAPHADLLTCLQTAVLAHCPDQPALPFTLFSSPRPSGDASSSVSVRRACLEAHFTAVRPQVSQTHLSELLAFYQQQAALVESEREAGLRATHSTPWVQPSVDAYYDDRLLQLITRVEASLGLLHAQCVLHANTSRRTTSSRVGGRARRAAGAFSVVAVKVMTRWYDQNLHHPYPSPEAAEVMAAAGGISVEQVRKWFCNKRRRGGNTRSLGQIAATRHRGRQLLAEAALMAGARTGCE